MVPQRWLLFDATDQVVGRLAVQIATILRGKHRPEYTPHVDTGEYVIVVNAGKLRFTGKKLQTKTYKWYTHFPGGLKEVTAGKVHAAHVRTVCEDAGQARAGTSLTPGWKRTDHRNSRAAVDDRPIPARVAAGWPHRQAGEGCQGLLRKAS